jgi:hypothetical protein
MRVAAIAVLLSASAAAQGQVHTISVAPAQPSAAPTATAPATAPSVASLSTASTSGEQLTNDTIITLVKAGLGPETVVAKINAAKGSYDTSTNALIQLKQAGVPDPVIAAMLNRSKSPVLTGGAVADNTNPDPMVPHSPGIYMLDPGGAGRMTKMDPTVSNQTKTSNIWGYAFSYGLSSAKVKTVIPNATARVQAVNHRPIFYFYFNQSGPLASMADFSMSFAAMSTSPSEFSLVHFDQKKDHREAAIMSIGLASVKSGVSDKARVPFTYEEAAPGVYKVTLSADLAAGEYGFVASMGAGTGMVARIFDFSVS